MNFFEALGFAWTLSGCATLGILYYVFTGTKTKEKLSLSGYVTACMLGPIGLGGVLTFLWHMRQECLEQIAAGLKKET